MRSIQIKLAVSCLAAVICVFATAQESYAQTAPNTLINNAYKSQRNRSTENCYVYFDPASSSSESTKITVYDSTGFARNITVESRLGTGRLSRGANAIARSVCVRGCTTMNYVDRVNNTPGGTVTCSTTPGGFTGHDDFGCDRSLLLVGQYYAGGNECIVYNTSSGCPATGGFHFDPSSNLCVNSSGGKEDYRPTPNPTGTNPNPDGDDDDDDNDTDTDTDSCKRLQSETLWFASGVRQVQIDGRCVPVTADWGCRLDKVKVTEGEGVLVRAVNARQYECIHIDSDWKTLEVYQPYHQSVIDQNTVLTAPNTPHQ